MSIQIQLAKQTEKETLKNLYSLYLHDMTQYDKKLVLNSDGLYELSGLDLIFNNEALIPYFIKEEGKLVGFLLLTGAAFAPEDSQWGVEDLFIVKGKRRKQIASRAVQLIMDQYKGKYCIFQSQKNRTALMFWHNFYAANSISYTEVERMEGGRICAVQNFVI